MVELIRDDGSFVYKRRCVSTGSILLGRDEVKGREVKEANVSRDQCEISFDDMDRVLLRTLGLHPVLVRRQGKDILVWGNNCSKSLKETRARFAPDQVIEAAFELHEGDLIGLVGLCDIISSYPPLI